MVRSKGRGVRRSSPVARGGSVSRMRMSRLTGGIGEFSKGYVSKAQWRLFFANPKLRRYAKKKAHATAGGKVVRYRRLPERKGVKKSVR